MATTLPFLSDEALETALLVLEEDRASYSLDAHYSAIGLVEDEVPEALRDAATTAAGNLSLLVRDGRIAVFREIVAPEDWDPAAETRPHLWWSHSAELAHAHWGEARGVRWLLSGSVDARHVDEAATIALNANPMLSDEGEIRLLRDAPPVAFAAERRPDGHRHPTL